MECKYSYEVSLAYFSKPFQTHTQCCLLVCRGPLCVAINHIFWWFTLLTFQLYLILNCGGYIYKGAIIVLYRIGLHYTKNNNDIIASLK